ncbi:MAG: hypothetical protein DSY80_08105 [Desulfocapsa sp.]|nr:MAG: hypothetical protein DSY80_08105 [Desulfocapsa sp.]
MQLEQAKIIVVTGSNMDQSLAQYALKVAQRLDLEVFVLFVDHGNSCGTDGQRKKAAILFEAEVKEEAARFTSLARDMDILVEIIVDVDSVESAIAAVLAQEKGIRFLICTRDLLPKTAKLKQQYPELTVIQPELSAGE